MSAVLSWYVVVEVMGLLAFVSAWPWLSRLPERGYCVSKSLGVLATGLALWLGTAYGVLRNEPGGAVLALAVLAAMAVLSALRYGSLRELLGWLRCNKKLVVGAEILFLGAFLAWLVVRAFDPAADHTEEPMDLLFLSSMTTSPDFPPRDPWLAGYPVSYYYFGYWLLGGLAQLTLQAPEIAYNVGQACWLGLLALGSFGLGVNLVALGHGDGRIGGRALAGGGLAAALVCLASNLHFPVSWLESALRSGPAPFREPGWWWWQASRAIEDRDLGGGTIEVITEFPFFSYLLGDNHPHLLAMPYVVLAATLALAFFLHIRGSGLVPRSADRIGDVLLPSVVLGALIPLNTWDYPGMLLLFLSAVGLALATGSRLATTDSRGTAAASGLTPHDSPPTTPHDSGLATHDSRLATSVARLPTLWRAALFALLLVVVAWLVYLPYFLTAQSQVRGLLPNLFHPTGLGELGIVFGVLLPGLLLLFWRAHRETPVSGRRVVGLFAGGVGAFALWLVAGWLWTSLSEEGGAWIEETIRPLDTGAALGVIVSRWGAGWPVTVLLLAGLSLVGSLLLERRSEAGRAPGVTFGLLLAAVGLLLVLAPELVYVRDNFGTRMNTVFKLYYQAWLLLALAAATGLALAWRGERLERAGCAVAGLLLATGLLYAPAAVWSKTDGFAGPPTLDALAWVERLAPGEREAIRWVRRHTRFDERLVQTVGDSYNARQDLLSAATGRPTLLGWVGHELQWRGSEYATMAAGRGEAVQGIYNPSSSAELARLVREWDVGLVYLGPAERARYAVTPQHEMRLGSVLELAFESGEARLYRRR